MNTQTMIVVCAWCPDAREQTAAATRLGYVVSHGLCPACTAKLVQEGFHAKTYSQRH